MQSFDFYSPEEQIYRASFAEAGLSVYFKRDDLIHPYISGNKWRKLKHQLLAAEAEGKTALITFGGAWSNHILATAAAAAKFNFQATAIIRGEEVSNPVLSLCKVYGMQLIFVSREDYKDKEALYRRYATESSYFIDEGGYGALGALGCSELVAELTEKYDYIFCAAGTGTTAAGLALGVENSLLTTQIHVIPVLKGGEFIQMEVQKLAPSAKDVTLHVDYHFGGYARTKPALLTFIKDFVADTGILIEPTYTGKLCYAVEDLAQQGYFPAGSRILLIHTGGLTGFIGMHERF